MLRPAWLGHEIYTPTILVFLILNEWRLADEISNYICFGLYEIMDSSELLGKLICAIIFSRTESRLSAKIRIAPFYCFPQFTIAYFFLL